MMLEGLGPQQQNLNLINLYSYSNLNKVCDIVNWQINDQ